MDARTYRGDFAKACTWGLIGATAAVALVGVLGMFTPDGDFLGLDRAGWCVAAFALVMAFAILLINHMADACMRAIDGRRLKDWHWPTLLSAGFCLAVYTIAANLGVHMGWEILIAVAAHAENLPSTESVGQVFLALSIAKPATRFAIAGCEAMDRARAEAREAAEDQQRQANLAAERANRHAENLARIGADGRAPNFFQNLTKPCGPISEIAGGESHAASPPPRGQRPKLVKNSGKVMAGAAAALELLAVGQTAHAAPISAQTDPVAHTQAVGQTARPWAAMNADEKDRARAEAQRRLTAGERPGPVSRSTGVPLSSCKRYAAAA